MSKKKLLIIGLVVVVVVVGLVALNAGQSGKKGRNVMTEKVTEGDLKQMVSATGRVVPPTEVKISANVSGRIEGIHVEEGDQVERGQLLVELDQDRYEYSVRKARASVAEAEARKAKAELEWERQQELFSRKLISKQEYDAAEADWKASNYSVDQWSANLAELQDYLDECTIRSPINGTITDLTAKQGENVVIGTMNNPGTVIMVVSDLSVIEIEAEVDETDVSFVEIGQSVEIELDAFPDTSFQGEVVKIGNSAEVSGFGSQDQATNFMVNVRLIEVVKNIKPGMTSSVDITTNTRDDVIQVPIQALVMREPKDTTSQEPEGETGADTDAGVAVAATEDEETDRPRRREEPKELEGVFVVSEGTVEFREVTTGIADQQYIEVTSGLDKGEEIVTGSFRVLRDLENGDPVKVDNSQLAKLGRGEA